jgi:DNA polymerase III delta prime subunit
MAMENFTRHQQSIIKNYYKNRDDVAFQRAQELLTDLYLAEGKKLEKVWDSMFTNLERLGVPPDQLEHLKKERKPELIAKLLEKKL